MKKLMMSLAIMGLVTGMAWAQNNPPVPAPGGAPQAQPPAQGPGGQGGKMDEERINKIAEKLGITPEEVRKRMANGELRDEMRNRQGQGEGPGGQQGGRQGQQGGMPGGMPGMMPGQGGAQGVAETSVVTTTDKFLFVIKGNYIFQFDVNTLELKNKTVINPELEKSQQVVEEAIRQRVAAMKQHIADLRAEGKTEEADRLEKAFKEVAKWFMQGGKTGERNKEKGKEKDKNKPGDAAAPAPAEGNNTNDTLF
ncbi:MAG: hypothetical protein ABIF71_01640 [Planctomycetota bacterium]